MKICKQILSLVIAGLVLTSCSGTTSSEASYPENPDDVRRDRGGKLSGDDGLVLLGGSSDEDSGQAGGAGIGVNAFLWRASLDTVAFMPLKSADPFGGVISTEWYENPEAPGERFKLDVVIMDTRLRSDAVRISAFKQVLKEGKWRDAKLDPEFSRKLEDKILTRARELRLAQRR